jgi:raffinose synthase
MRLTFGACPVLLAWALSAAAARPGEIEVHTDKRSIAAAPLAGLSLTVRTEKGQLAGTLGAVQRGQGRDRAGAYTSERYPVTLVDRHGRPSAARATLELRTYRERPSVVGTLEYDGPALRARSGIELSMKLEDFSKGLALYHFRADWTRPRVISDWRRLPKSTQLLLWQGRRQSDYQVLVPLAGDGMVGQVEPGRDEIKVSLSSDATGWSPHRVPVFAFAAGDDPFALAPRAYAAAFASAGYRGRLREDKQLPPTFDRLGWCSWNAYGPNIDAKKILESTSSLRAKGIPLGFVILDDGWLSTKSPPLIRRITSRFDRLTGFAPDAKRFPGGFGELTRKLHAQGISVGVWHALSGSWEGVAAGSEVAAASKLLDARWGKKIPHPQAKRPTLYDTWYRTLAAQGIDFVKVDVQYGIKNGKIPFFSTGAGLERQVEQAASSAFSPGAGDCRVLNCMAMTLPNAFNWRSSDLARNSQDYVPDELFWRLAHPLQTFARVSKEHVQQNAYNALWTSVFAVPDHDMFRSYGRGAEYHAIARAISGGPIYITDSPGKEQPELLRRLIGADGRVLRLDGPGLPSRDSLFADPEHQAVALKVRGRISRPGMPSAGMVAAFNVNGRAESVSGQLRVDDVEGLAAKGPVAVYQRGACSTHVLSAGRSAVGFRVSGLQPELFTLAPISRGAAVFGLLDKYLGPAAVVEQTWAGSRLQLKLADSGELGVWLERAPSAVAVNGRQVPYRFDASRHLLIVRVAKPATGQPLVTLSL